MFVFDFWVWGERGKLVFCFLAEQYFCPGAFWLGLSLGLEVELGVGVGLGLGVVSDVMAGLGVGFELR